MKFLEAVWAKISPSITSKDSGVPENSDSAPAAAATGAQPPQGPGLTGLAVRCASDLREGIFTDRQRVKWVLLQPEVETLALRFASLAGQGEARGAEAQESRQSLHRLLVIELPSESPEHIDLLLDSIQRAALRRRFQPAAAVPLVAPATDEPETPAWTAEVPAVVDPASSSRPAPEPVYSEPADEPYGGTYAATAERASARRASGARDLDTDESAVAPLEYELTALPGTSTADLDTELVREYLRGPTRRRSAGGVSDVGLIDAMRELKAVSGPSGRERLTVLGALFFAKRPERLLVQSKVRFVEFPGVAVATTGEKVAYRYTEEVTGTITQLIARMERLHKERLAPGVLADGFRLEELPAVPLFALREAMVNAVCHRDYSLVGANIQVRLFADRLEVQSPGGLPGPVTVENILTESYARNPRVADILRDLGYVERHGLGIDNMYSSMEEGHLPPPEFRNSETSFTVILRFRPAEETDPEAWLHEIGAASLDPDMQKALVYARRVGRIAASDYASFSLEQDSQTEKRLRRLVRDGWLIQHGTGTDAYYSLGPKADATPPSHDVDSPLPAEVVNALPASQRRIFDIVARHGRTKVSEVLEISGLKDRRTVQRTLAALAAQGLVVRRARSATDPNATYEVNCEFGGECEEDAPE
ncbi:MAG: hypothetical protein HGB10_09960 [Coriobacteriia bacterium]|nr:hypothetical protein [Coriobacteriia bacterium]